MDEQKKWFEEFKKSPEFALLHKRPLTYFCAEFAINDIAPTYAGGLGILAGDLIREAADQEIPIIGVGLYYHEGYICRQLQKGEVVEKVCMVTSPQNAGLTPVVNDKGEPLFFDIPIQERRVHIRVWKWTQGSACIYFLDTNIPENDAADRNITNRLYTDDKETRLKQEIVLGIGGLRFLQIMKVDPLIYHLNEGHSAFLALEIARYETEKHDQGFLEQLERAKRHIVFTNHTLVPAGHDTFSNDLVATLLTSYAVEAKVPVNDLVALGLVQESSIFSMTMLALRMATRINAVSNLHRKKAQDVWKDHPMEAITNGIHAGSWDQVGQGEIWQKHQENKKKLLNVITQATGNVWGEQDFLVGWARRIVGYKRPLSLFEDIQRVKSLCQKSDQPLRIVVAGQANENDPEGNIILEKLHQILSTDLKGYVVYLPDYEINLAKLMTAGCDIWLNTPIVGFEACGTSGMKAALNGVLPVSTRDGWVDEVDLYQKGWILNNNQVNSHLLDLLEREIMPLYYTKDAQGIPSSWVTNMKNARALILNQYTTTRTLKEYFEKFYLQIIKAHLAPQDTR